MYETHNFVSELFRAMLQLTSVLGNIFDDAGFGRKYRRAKAAGECDRLLLSRVEMEKLRLRRRTEGGTDIGIVLEPGFRLRHGDVLVGKPFTVVEQLPEKVLSMKIERGGADKMIRLAALVGHTIGNRHRPIAVDHGTISFPLQAESEIDIFKKLLPAGMKMKVANKIFLPTGEAHSHG